MPTPLKILIPLLIMAIQAVTGADGLKLRACHGNLGFVGEHSHECAAHGEAEHPHACDKLDLNAPTGLPSESPSGPSIAAACDDCVLFTVLGSRNDVPSTDTAPLVPPTSWVAVAILDHRDAWALPRPVDCPRGPPDGLIRNSAERAGALPLRL